jgi:hypothetical protein
MQAKDHHLYVMCHGDNEPRYSSSASLHWMKLGAENSSMEKQQQLNHAGWALDNSGHNISTYNKWWSELTGIYWLVNNATEEFIGNAQYRRQWADEGLEPSSPLVVYIPEPERFGFSIARQYREGHVGMDGIEQALLAADRGQMPITREELELAFNQNIFFGHIMARGAHVNYCEIMQTLLDCMWPIWDNCQEQIRQIEGYNCRYISFLAERIMTALVLHRDKVWPGISIETAPINFFP